MSVSQASFTLHWPEVLQVVQYCSVVHTRPASQSARVWHWGSTPASSTGLVGGHAAQRQGREEAQRPRHGSTITSPLGQVTSTTSQMSPFLLSVLLASAFKMPKR